MEITEQEIKEVFDKWAHYYSKLPENFTKDIIDKDGNPNEDYGENCVRCFLLLLKEVRNEVVGE